MLENFDPNTIQGKALRQMVINLMNLVENLHAKVQEQAEEMQRLRDENNRLKGEQGKPAMKPNKPSKDGSHFSKFGEKWPILCKTSVSPICKTIGKMTIFARNLMPSQHSGWHR